MESEATNATTERQQGAPNLLVDFITEKDLAREISVSLKTLNRWAAVGIGPARTRIGRRVLYRRSAITAWLTACEQDHHHQRRRHRGDARTTRRRATAA